MVVDRVRLRDILDALMRLSWKYGLGRYEIAANGRLLVRGPVDTSVASPERLIYEGRAEVSRRLSTPGSASARSWTAMC